MGYLPTPPSSMGNTPTDRRLRRPEIRRVRRSEKTAEPSAGRNRSLKDPQLASQPHKGFRGRPQSHNGHGHGKSIYTQPAYIPNDQDHVEEYTPSSPAAYNLFSGMPLPPKSHNSELLNSSLPLSASLAVHDLAISSIPFLFQSPVLAPRMSTDDPITSDDSFTSFEVSPGGSCETEDSGYRSGSPPRLSPTAGEKLHVAREVSITFLAREFFGSGKGELVEARPDFEESSLHSEKLCNPVERESGDELHFDSDMELGLIRSNTAMITPASQARNGGFPLLGSVHSSAHSTDNPTDSNTDTESDDSQSVSFERESELIVLQSKHALFVTLMRDVYAFFEGGWIGAVQEHTGPSASAPSKLNPFSDNSKPSKGQKRGREDRDSTPPKDGQDGRVKRHQQSAASGKEIRLFACSFYKNNSTKYSCNGIDGSKFRACAGPGFNTIARLKQHLKRVHSAPIQCTRCWLVMPDLHAMSTHANQEIRCERQEPRPEGLSSDKMRLITSKWGATWADIYSIIFPGALVPSPYYDYDSTESSRTRSTQSRDLAGFEAYYRTELPRLVEANLQAMVNAESAPLEESLRAMLVDIVRRCQSTVAQNYNRIRLSGAVENHAPQVEPNPTTMRPPTEVVTADALLMSLEMSDTNERPTQYTDYIPSLYFEEPPFLGTEAAAIDLGLYNPFFSTTGLDDSAGEASSSSYKAEIPVES